MKKVILTAAIILGGLSTYATSTSVINKTNDITITAQEEFKEIKAEELPQAVKDAFTKDLETATLQKAYVNAEQEYKLDITVDGAPITVYADKEGNWIQKQ